MALAKSTQPAEQAIDAAAVSATKELTDHMKDGLQLSGEFAEIGGQHMFDLKQGGCSIKSVGEKKWTDLRETARMGISKQTCANTHWLPGPHPRFAVSVNDDNAAYCVRAGWCCTLARW